MKKQSARTVRGFEYWRKDDDGDLDDVTVPDVEMVRMERMDANCWWLCLHCKDGRQIHCDIVAGPSGVLLSRRED